jgi:murein DD-endopeptidase MepM/ murein hydrolase activator NlpD
MNKAIFKKNIKWPYLVAFSAASIFLLAYTILGKAAYTIYRPIDNNGGQVNQTYLWAEETEINPNEWVTHKGLDFSYPTGTNVYAVADGTVIQIDEHYQNGERESPWGNYVLIRHSQQHYDRLNQQIAYVYSMYLHLSQNSIQVLPGQNVDADQFIAQVDDTGGGLPDQPAPHLHLQIVIHPLGDRTLVPNTLDANNRSRNPELWLSPYNGNTARAVGLITDSSGNPLTDVIICGIVKPYGGYGFSRTYSYTCVIDRGRLYQS